MWYLMYVQKDEEVAALLFDLENPTLIHDRGDDYLFPSPCKERRKKDAD